MMFNEVISEYERLEPPGTDTWNPLHNEKELWHRIRLFASLTSAIRQIPIPVHELRILDVGCGVGRSTRALIELGASPGNILGIDLRVAAIEYAKNLNPAIPFCVVTDASEWSTLGQFDLCMQCTVFSSIAGFDRRMMIADLMDKVVGENGFVFWWDGIRANTFAGGDRLDPPTFFPLRRLIHSEKVPLRPTVQESLKGGQLATLVSQVAQSFGGHTPTHCVALFGRRI